MYNLHCSIADPVLAVKDTWVIGDKFLMSHYHAFPAMRDEAHQAQAKRDEPYLFKYYNMKPFYDANLASKNVFLCMIDNIETAI